MRKTKEYKKKKRRLNKQFRKLNKQLQNDVFGTRFVAKLDCVHKCFYDTSDGFYVLIGHFTCLDTKTGETRENWFDEYDLHRFTMEGLWFAMNDLIIKSDFWDNYKKDNDYKK